MKLKNFLSFWAFLILGFTRQSFAQSEADNSSVNKRDNGKVEMTADNQKSNQRDTHITARIRKDIMKEKQFSTYAQNIKIITVDGKVTLKGPVRTMAEQNRILKFARSAAGSSIVVNEIEITPAEKN